MSRGRLDGEGHLFGLGRSEEEELGSKFEKLESQRSVKVKFKDLSFLFLFF